MTNENQKTLPQVQELPKQLKWLYLLLWSAKRQNHNLRNSED